MFFTPTVNSYSDYCRSPAYALDAREIAQVEQFLDEFAAWLGPGS